MSRTDKAFLALLAVVAGLAGVQTYRLRMARIEAATAVAAKQRAILEATGWERAITAKQDEMDATVGELSRQLDEARRTGASVVYVDRTTGHGDPIPVPCPSWAPPGNPATPAVPPDSGATKSGGALPVTPWVRLAEAIVADDGGGIYVKRDIAVQLQAGEWYSGWEPVNNLDAPAAKVSRDLELAWSAYRMTRPLPWEVTLTAMVGTDPSVRLGGAWYATGRRVGLAVEYGRTTSEATVAAGVTWRVGPR